MPEAGGITCDVCGADCFAESYYMDSTQEDYCVACFKAEGGMKYYPDAEYQREGKPVPTDQQPKKEEQ